MNSVHLFFSRKTSDHPFCCIAGRDLPLSIPSSLEVEGGRGVGVGGCSPSLYKAESHLRTCLVHCPPLQLAVMKGAV